MEWLHRFHHASHIPASGRLREIAEEELHRAGFRPGQRVPRSQLIMVLSRATRRLLDEDESHGQGR